MFKFKKKNTEEEQPEAEKTVPVKTEEAAINPPAEHAAEQGVQKAGQGAAISADEMREFEEFRRQKRHWN